MKQKFYPVISFFFILFFQQSAFSQQFSLLKDINPGSDGSSYISGYSYFYFTNVNGVLFFIANDGVHGHELWKSDGTEAGCKMVKDIFPGFERSELNQFVNVDGILYFIANDGVHGRELWKSDGTEAGTQMVKDINPGPNSGEPQPGYTNYLLNGEFYFTALDASNGRELWKTDGTEAGTVLIKDIYPGKITSGLGTGSPYSSRPANFVSLNGFLYFTAYDNPSGMKLWKTDGTETGTVLIKEIYPWTGISLHNFTVLNGSIYFTAYSTSENLTEIWKSDGTENGTVLIKTGFIGPPAAWPFTILNNNLYFIHEGIWRCDGTEAGTVLLKDKPHTPTPGLQLLTSLNGHIYFTGADPTHGFELWKSDGTVAGTTLVKDINPGTGNSNINAFVIAGNKLMFSANDGVHGTELWVSDGTDAGTKLVQDFEPGNGSGLTSFGFELNGQAIEVNGKIFVDVKTSALGNEIWVTGIPSEIGLPLDLLEFKGSIVNNDGQLHWKTENENNTSSFIIERSIDGRSYKTLGSVTAANSPGVHHYSFRDVDIVLLGASVIYYRLKQTDIDGRYTYSNIVTLLVDNKSSSVMLYPNPVKNSINLTINVPQKEKIQWQLSDNAGRIVKLGMYDLSPGSTAVSIDIPNLSSGIYFMQLNGATLLQVIKLVKQ